MKLFNAILTAALTLAPFSALAETEDNIVFIFDKEAQTLEATRYSTATRAVMYCDGGDTDNANCQGSKIVVIDPDVLEPVCLPVEIDLDLVAELDQACFRLDPEMHQGYAKCSSRYTSYD